jgi:hypothetical protein
MAAAQPQPEPEPRTRPLFERRGVSLEFMQALAEVAATFSACPRVLLRGGGTGVRLPWARAPAGQALVQRRTVDVATHHIAREHELLPQDEILGVLPAAVGERVFYTVGAGAAEACCTVTAHMGGATAGTYTLTQCSLPGVQHECNHALAFASGAEIVDVPHADVRLDPSFTTKDVCEELVKPLTAPSLESMVDLLVAGASVRNPPEHTGGPAAGVVAACAASSPVGDATDFTSHAWKYRFCDLVGAIAEHVRTAELDPACTWFWLDICTVNQHPAAQRSLPPDYFYTTFRDGIAAIGRTVLILFPWRDPIPLKRSWCLWEIVCTNTSRAALSVVLSPDEVTTFELALSEDFDAVDRCMQSIDVTNSEAFFANDQTRILAAAREVVGGVATLNTEIKRQLRGWLAHVTRQLVDREMLPTHDPEVVPAPATADDAVRRSNLFEGAAKLQVHLGHVTEALPLFELAVGLRAQALGADHARTLSARWCGVRCVLFGAF